MKVMVKYAFIFDPNDGFSNQGDFERAIENCFKSQGFDGEMVEPAPGQEQIPTVYLTKSKDTLMPTSGPVKFDPPKPNV